MSVELLLSELRTLDIRLSVEGDQLRCSAPKGRLTKELEQRIAANKSILIQTFRNSTSTAHSIPRRPAAGATLPLSFAQERFWFLQNFEPDSTAYNITAFRRVFAHVDASQLEFALHAVVDRHEILRTNFLEVDGSPTQVIRQQMYPELAIYDISHLQPSEQAAASDSVIEKLSKQTFDVAGEPLLRVALLRESEQESRIVLTMHHIICDAWSIGIFFTEMTTFYGASSSVHTLEPGLPLQYGDYAAWERDRHSSSSFSPQIDYWKTKLKGLSGYLEVPPDHARPESLMYQGRLHRFQLSPALSESLRSLARQEGATLFMVLLAIFKGLLFRYTQQSDIVVGTPVSTRTQADLEKLIGCFINTLVLRTEVAKGATTRDLLARVRATVLESLNHADIPLEILLSELVTARDLSHSPLFQVAFILQNTPAASKYEVVSGGATLDMTLYMWDADGVIGGSVEYNAALYNPQTIARFAGCFQTLAAEMACQPDVAIERLPILTAAQEAEWFEQYNGPAISVPGICTHEWIDVQASKTPDAVAVVFDDEQLTYQELTERSNRLAHRLQDLGVGRESLVAVCLNRSAELAVAPIAVWKAGGAYVPLDPEFPRDRLAFMLENSNAAVLITESKLLDRLPLHLPKLICVDRDRHILQKASPETPTSLATPENLAYVLYTSGSTGKPKGVEIEHRALANFLASMQCQLGSSRSDRLLAVTTFSFDIAGLELYLPLVSGGRVVIAPRSAAFDGAALAKILTGSAINIMQATPVTWRLLLESGWQGTPGLKILCGGEALTPDLAGQLVATGAEVWNLYGPTETTIWSTLQRVISQDEPISIGRPIANTQVYLLDEYGQPVPPGVPGELYIGGNGLARGYLQREELTAERFVNSTFHSGKRLYRTGDLARRLPSGDLEYKGRADHQVKVRGFRIELGEIEAALEQQPGVSQAVVVVREDNAGDQQLTAYMTTRGHALPESGVLRKALMTFLPEYMVPSSFVQIDSFPLTPNRKVDRRSLLAPEYRPGQIWEGPSLIDGSARTELQTSDMSPNRYVPPSNDMELTMAEIWRDVLGLQKVSVLDNFFEMGGHSLSAVRLISRLRVAMGMDLPLRCIFIHPTISELSNHISYDAATHSYRYTSELPKWSCLVPVQPRGGRTPLFFVAGYANPDETLLLTSQMIAHLGMDQPLFGLRPRWIEGNEGYATVEEMAREFLAELRTVQPKGPYLLGGHCVGGVAALEVAQLLLQEGEEVKMMVFLDTERPTALRTFLVELFYLRKRIEHILEVISEIVHASRGARSEMIRKLVHRKLREKDRFYESKVGYRRQLYHHTPKRYPGRITLIVNEEQARSDRDLGWTGIAQGGLDIHTVPGSHFTVMDRHAKEVALAILKAMREAVVEPLHEQPERTEVNAV
ncbi:MAG TPA: amino acid adenylation domain-containing protein [Terracidiphilus sp.]